MSKTIETDLRTFIRFWLVPLGIGLALLIIYKAAAGLILIGISIFLALALKPLVRKVNHLFSKYFGAEKKHQTISAIFAYIIVVTIIGGILAIIGPVVVSETAKFIQQFPTTFDKTMGGWDGINDFGKAIGIENLQAQISTSLSSFANNILSTFGSSVVASVGSIASFIMNTVLVLVLTLLFLLDGPDMLESLWKLLGTRAESKKPVAVARDVVAKMANVVSTYVSRQVIVAIIDGLASGLIVFVLSLFTGISSTIAIPMGLTTMLFYLIPMFGQFIGGTIVTIVLLFTSPLAAIIFAAVYIIYAQIENNIIAPKIQGNALKLPAVAILSAIVIGMFMFGLLGAIIAIPIAGCVRVLIEEYPNIVAARK